MYRGNNGNPVFPVFLEENQFYDANASTTQLQLFGTSEFPTACNVDPTNYIGNNNISSINQPSKRTRESEEVAMQHKLQISLNNLYQDEADRSASIPNPNAVSTGLRLSYDDDEHNSSVTTASGSMPPLPVIMSLGDNLRTEIERQKEEFDQYIRVQEEQFAKGVKEMKQRHITSFLSAVDKGVSRKLREKELEIENMNRKNRDLADRIKQAASEAQTWQYRARHNESVVHALQNNLKQALAAQGAAAAAAADQGREGCGESEVDDAASSYDPNAGHRQQQLQIPTVGACRVCVRREVCMLLLPCRHLCMCKECDRLVDACPVCLAIKTASVEVYMS
ncbi:putative BOI-related E3 ubiquitin-protein ligase 3 isoform X1 [Iris pallida]|uniref:BOI-related E3 ubiquitin-protein ligase 3 isoform X1 n=1 Tax=Iris pallida TaxID=29817 RepID=A0AAX6DVM1_IRIPA|nr:putative BOI-related E3 ubiquitin-protein ligase 3 isoform X1 [Iris pallida]